MPLTSAELQALRTLTERDGVVKTARAIGLSRATLTAALAQLPIRPGSVALIRAALAT